MADFPDLRLAEVGWDLAASVAVARATAVSEAEGSDWVAVDLGLVASLVVNDTHSQ